MRHLTRARRLSTMLVIVVLGFPAMAAAQYVGIKGGLNSGTIIVSPDPAPEVFSQRTAPVVGFFFASSGDERIGLHWELLYSQKGAKGTGPFVGSVRLDYAELPLMASVLLADSGGLRVRANVGVSADYLLTARLTAGGVTTGITSTYERTDVGLVFGGSVSVSRVLFDVRYGLGLRNTIKNSTATTKTRTLSLTAGVWF